MIQIYKIHIYRYIITAIKNNVNPDKIGVKRESYQKRSV